MVFNKLLEVFDDVLSNEESKAIKDCVLSSEFPWYLQPETVPYLNTEADIWKRDPKIFKDCAFFSHIFSKGSHSDSNYVDLASFIFNKLNQVKGFSYKELIRSQANLMMRSCHGLHTPAHLDNEIPHHVLLYYVNDCDGSTLLFEDDGSLIDEIHPKMGRIVLFDGSIIHAGGAPKNSECRVVFNLNLKI